MTTYYCYSDADSGHIEADSIQEAAEKWGIPSEAQIADGAWLVVRDEKTMNSITWGDPQ